GCGVGSGAVASTGLLSCESPRRCPAQTSSMPWLDEIASTTALVSNVRSCAVASSLGARFHLNLYETWLSHRRVECACRAGRSHRCPATAPNCRARLSPCSRRVTGWPRHLAGGLAVIEIGAHLNNRWAPMQAKQSQSRRVHDADFKVTVLSQCQQPG